MTKFRSKSETTTLSCISFVLLTILLTLGCPDSLFSQSDQSTFKVVIDAGHGGKDPGCLGSRSKEKDLALDVSLLIGKKIRALFPQIDVLYTREDDTFIPLKQRANIANKAHADLFISVHCNYAPKKPHVQGTETFVMGLHKAASNLDVVKRENAVIELEDDQEVYDELDPNSPIGHIILQNRQNANLDQSIQVASLVQEEFTDGLHRNNRGVKQAGFLVLYHTTMPSILIELGFLSNKQEEDYLMSAEGQNELANAVSKAFARYLEQIKPEEEPVIAAKAESIPEPVKATRTLSYKIQLAASKNKPLHMAAPSPWENLEDYEIVAENGLYKYLTGNFRSLREASEARNALRNMGFPGAFVVAYEGTKRIVFDK